ncbi:MAG: hypothetical protein FWG88_10065 [Oscillospiraceae bacterium]|nr:hypothetical protein [Oscillospiraceae bacterium]
MSYYGGGGRDRRETRTARESASVHEGNFILMRKDVPVCAFSINSSRGANYRIAVDILETFDEERLPIEVQNFSNMGYFLIERLTPVFRGYLGRSVLINGEPLSNSIRNIIEYTGGMSLIDDFWMKLPGDDEKTWEKCNLFTNDISDEIAAISFSGDGRYNADGFVHSPEFTTDGMMDKAWRRIDGKTSLYKAGTGWGNQGNVQYSEYYAAQIAQRLGLRHVNYGLETWLGRLCSTCELFTSEKYSYLSGKKALSGDVDSFVASLDKDSQIYQDLADTLLFDGIVGNGRHLGNFGFIQDNDTMELVGLAPIFDNGSALFNRIPDANLIIPAYTSTFFKLSSRMYHQASVNEIRAMLTARQFELAKLMDGFEFTRHPEHNLNDGRLKVLERIVQRRALQLT